MKTRTNNKWSLCLTWISLSLVFAATDAAGQNSPVEPRLRALAEAALRAEGRVLMSGDVAAALQGIPEADDIRGAMERPGAAARGRNEANAKGGITVVRTTERIVSATPKVSGTTATLDAEVVLERYMKAEQGRPEKWVESGTYRFHFEQQNGANWRLLRYEEVDPFGLSRPEQAPGAPKLGPVNDGAAGTNPGEGRGRPKGPAQPRPGAQAPSQPQVMFASYMQAQTYTYDWEAARRYARIWACPAGTSCYPLGNTAYRNFERDGSTRGGDCTNFVSQSLRAGGWKDLGGYLNYSSTDAWWYDSFKQSYTWVGAHYFYQFLAAHPQRAGRGSSVWDLLTGDVLQIDFEGDGSIDHTMIVSWRYETQPVQLFLSYHTTNTLDRPLSDFIQYNKTYYPNARYYAWFIWASD